MKGGGYVVFPPVGNSVVASLSTSVRKPPGCASGPFPTPAAHLVLSSDIYPVNLRLSLGYR